MTALFLGIGFILCICGMGVTGYDGKKGGKYYERMCLLLVSLGIGFALLALIVPALL
jgi:hypothetical protein